MVADSSRAGVVYATSNSTFGIQGRLQVTQPTDSGIVMTYGGNPYNITWTKFGTIATVQLRYSTDGGLTWPAGKIIADVVNVTTGTPYA